MAIEQSLVTLPQCYNKQDYDWSEELDSVHILAQAVQEAPLFEWLFIYLSCFRTIDLISLLCCYVELRFNARFFRNTNCECQRRWDKIHISFGAMVQTEASWYSRPCPPVSLIIRYYHNNDPGTGGRLESDGTCCDQWDIIGQVEQLHIHSLDNQARSFKLRFSASSASRYELNKLSLLLSGFLLSLMKCCICSAYYIFSLKH